jgi:uncharacterized protein
MKTAFITGASGGLGLEFAKLFAQKGINLILVARNEERLQQIAKDLLVYHIDVKIYARDLSVMDNVLFIYNDLKSKHIDVDYLVNNAGFGLNNSFTEIDWQKELEMYQLNMITLAFFTKAFAKDMIDRKFGRILNVGSTGSFQPGPYMAGYCASKAFVLNLSEAINYELKGTNVTVSTLCPGVTDTNFHTVAQTHNTFMSKYQTHATPEEVAKYGFLMMMKQKSVGVHGIINRLMVFSLRFTCRKMVVALAGRILKKR